uniref:Mpv17-like protein n=1 Tax=Cuerna arida TaxID=1464854 RepID=A0A1B6GFQ9_9HEMI
MSSIFSKVVQFSKKYPLSRGMASYALIWPLGSLAQQTIFGETEYDYAKVARFSLYGSCYVAPTLHCWIKIANTIWPHNTLRSAVTKAIVEQFTYTPFGMLSFYFGMTLLEGKTIEEGKAEVEAKFLPTYKIGACVWPVLQTFNYTVIKERNRVVFVSFCSLMWTTFLAYMKHLEHHEVTGGPQPDTVSPPVPPAVKAMHLTPTETTDKSWFVSRQVDR